jgi:hypothetical protein
VDLQELRGLLAKAAEAANVVFRWQNACCQSCGWALLEREFGDDAEERLVFCHEQDVDHAFGEHFDEDEEFWEGCPDCDGSGDAGEDEDGESCWNCDGRGEVWEVVEGEKVDAPDDASWVGPLLLAHHNLRGADDAFVQALQGLGLRVEWSGSQAERLAVHPA